MTDAEGARVTIGGLMKRIELLECQRRDDDAANRGLVRRIGTLQSEVEEKKRLWVEAMDEAQAWKYRAEAAEARVEESDETAHLANGTVALALKHRDAAEARVADLEAKLARADRLAEAADALSPVATDDEWRRMREVVATYRPHKKEGEQDEEV